MSFRRLAPFALALALVAGFSDPSAARGRPLRGPNLVADQVVPGPGDVTASGNFSVSAGRDQVSFRIEVANISGFINTIAIYRAPVGSTGPMVVRLSPSPIGINQLIGSVPVSRELAREIGRSPEAFYLEVRTTVHPGGALRGQLK